MEVNKEVGHKGRRLPSEDTTREKTLQRRKLHQEGEMTKNILALWS